jgi:hypothetical protein
MLLVAPRAQVELVVWHLGAFNDSFGRWCWAVPLDGRLHGLVDEVAQCLGKPVGGVAHRLPVGPL